MQKKILKLTLEHQEEKLLKFELTKILTLGELIAIEPSILTDFHLISTIFSSYYAIRFLFLELSC